MLGRMDYTIITVPARKKVMGLKSLLLVINGCFVFEPEVQWGNQMGNKVP